MFQSFDTCLINNHIIKFNRTRQTSEGLSRTYHDFLCPHNFNIITKRYRKFGISAWSVSTSDTQEFSGASGPRTILNSLQNSLAAELVNATSRTFLAYPSHTILTARKLPVVVFPHPAGPITPATPPESIRQFSILS